MASIARVADRAVDSHCSHSPGRSDNILSSNSRLCFTFAKLASLFSDNTVPLSLPFEGRCLEDPGDILQKTLVLMDIETGFSSISITLETKEAIAAIDFDPGTI